MNENISTGYFLRFKNPEEEKDFKEFLIENDYTPDSEGLREFILDSVYEEEKENESPIVKVFTENPEAIKTGLNFVARKLNDKIFGTKKPS